MIITCALEHTTAWDMAVILAKHVDSLPDTESWQVESPLIHGVRTISEGIGYELYKRRRYRIRRYSSSLDEPHYYGIWDRRDESWFCDPAFQLLSAVVQHRKSVLSTL